MMTEETVRNLFSFLDDESDSVAYGAMAELLQYADLPDGLLKEFQESSNPLMRKRIHQLESILTIRHRRKNFLRLLDNPSGIDLADCLAEIHLMWYDNDSKPGISELLGEFFAAAENYAIADIVQLGDFMRKSNFSTPIDGETLNPDNYCIGSVLTEHTGSEIMLCLLALLASFSSSLQLRMARIMDNFVLTDSSGIWLMPSGNWQTGKLSAAAAPEYWDDGKQIMKYIVLQLFTAAVASSSFRYIHTITAALLGSDGTGSGQDFLPFPYRPAKDEDFKQ